MLHNNVMLAVLILTTITLVHGLRPISYYRRQVESDAQTEQSIQSESSTDQSTSVPENIVDTAATLESSPPSETEAKKEAVSTDDAAQQSTSDPENIVSTDASNLESSPSEGTEGQRETESPEKPADSATVTELIESPDASSQNIEAASSDLTSVTPLVDELRDEEGRPGLLLEPYTAQILEDSTTAIEDEEVETETPEVPQYGRIESDDDDDEVTLGPGILKTGQPEVIPISNRFLPHINESRSSPNTDDDQQGTNVDLLETNDDDQQETNEQQMETTTRLRYIPQYQTIIWKESFERDDQTTEPPLSQDYIDSLHLPQAMPIVPEETKEPSSTLKNNSGPTFIPVLTFDKGPHETADTVTDTANEQSPSTKETELKVVTADDSDANKDLLISFPTKETVGFGLETTEAVKTTEAAEITEAAETTEALPTTKAVETTGPVEKTEVVETTKTVETKEAVEMTQAPETTNAQIQLKEAEIVITQDQDADRPSPPQIHKFADVPYVDSANELESQTKQGEDLLTNKDPLFETNIAVALKNNNEQDAETTNSAEKTTVIDLGVVEVNEQVKESDEEIKNIVEKYFKSIPDVPAQYVMNEGLAKSITHYFKKKVIALPLFHVNMKIDRNLVKIPWQQGKPFKDPKGYPYKVIPGFL